MTPLSAFALGLFLGAGIALYVVWSVRRAVFGDVIEEPTNLLQYGPRTVSHLPGVCSHGVPWAADCQRCDVLLGAVGEMESLR